MAHEDISQQTAVEHGLLKSITESLRLAIGWRLEGSDVSRKLSTVRFIVHSLQRHLDHLFALEEYDGYMDVVLALSPHSSKRVEVLRREHDHFRKAISHIVHGLEHVSLTDQPMLDNVCVELLAFLKKLDEHSRKETHLLQEAFKQEGGGEG